MGNEIQTSNSQTLPDFSGTAVPLCQQCLVPVIIC